jgi:hypothetical protein
MTIKSVGRRLRAVAEDALPQEIGATIRELVEVLRESLALTRAQRDQLLETTQVTVHGHEGSWVAEGDDTTAIGATRGETLANLGRKLDAEDAADVRAYDEAKADRENQGSVVPLAEFEGQMRQAQAQ